MNNERIIFKSKYSKKASRLFAIGRVAGLLTSCIGGVLLALNIIAKESITIALMCILGGIIVLIPSLILGHYGNETIWIEGKYLYRSNGSIPKGYVEVVDLATIGDVSYSKKTKKIIVECKAILALYNEETHQLASMGKPKEHIILTDCYTPSLYGCLQEIKSLDSSAK